MSNTPNQALPTTTPVDPLADPVEGAPPATSVMAPEIDSNKISRIGQQVMRFFHRGQGPLSAMTSYAIRQFLRPVALEMGSSYMEMAVTQSDRATTVYAMTPSASAAMSSHSMKLMKLMANLAGAVLEMEHEKLIPAIEMNRERWLHLIPKFVVATKKDKDWAAWRQEKLPDQLLATMRQSIVDGIDKALQPWSGVAESYFTKTEMLEIIDPGKPMVIASGGPTFMTRLGVKVIASRRIEGGIFIGDYNYLGMGRVLRLSSLEK